MRFLSFFKNIIDEDVKKKTDFLRETKIFGKIPGRKLVHVLGALRERDYVKDEVIFSEGEIGRALFIVQSGRIDLYKNMPDGGRKKIASVNPGEFFGEMALLEERPRTTTAIVGEDTHVFLLFKIKLDILLYSKPDIGVIISTRLAKIISARLRGMIDYLESGERKNDF